MFNAMLVLEAPIWVKTFENWIMVNMLCQVKRSVEFTEFSVTQILREIKVSKEFRVLKSAILTHFESEFDFS